MFQSIRRRQGRFRFVQPAFFGFQNRFFTTTNHFFVATTGTDFDEHFGTNF